MVPARRIEARRREVRIDHRERVLGGGHHLAPEDPPVRAIPGRRFVRSNDMDQLVVGHPVHSLVAEHDLEGVGKGSNRDVDVVVGNGRRSGIPAVAEVVEKERHLFRRCVVEETPIEPEGVLKAAGRVLRDVRLGSEVDDVEVLGLEGLHLACCPRRQGEQENNAG